MTRANLRLSVLDQSPIGEGRSAADALRDSVELAESVDALGYTRYWVAEHHGSPGFAGTAPEILTGQLLARTRNLRVGPGGVLLPRYPAAKVAEVFNVLASLYPGRVDLGLGRTGGPAADFPDQLLEVRARLGLIPEVVAEGPDQTAPVPPRVWLLGGGTRSARLAGHLGTSLAYAYFLVPNPGTAPLEAYRQELAAAGHAPQTGVMAVRTVVADTEARAHDLAQSLLLWRSRKDLGSDLPFPSVENTRDHRWTSAESERAAVISRTLVSGTPEQVHARLSGLAAEYGVDEILVNTLTADPADRVRSYELLGEVFGLRRASRDAVAA